jgi:hypothetical protein
MRRFTLIELLSIFLVIGLLCLLMWPAMMKGGAGKNSCARNLRQIGIALLFYAGENNGWLPNDVPNGTSFAILNTQGYLADSSVYGCPQVSEPSTRAAFSNYRYIGSGLRTDDPEPAINSMAYDQSGNHPGNSWMNVLFRDGVVARRKPGELSGTND